MNLLITTKCNLDCSYCFAGAHLKSAFPQEMSLEEVLRVITRMDPDRDWVRLMGGEPTLHSQYPEIIQLLKIRGFKVVVFTNGLQSILRETKPYLPDRILLNLNDLSWYSKPHRKSIIDNLSDLDSRIGLAYTILTPNFDLSAHQELIKTHGLQPVLRIGLAQPSLGGDNDYLPDADLPAAHAGVVAWAKRLSLDGIRLSFDCGFMRCLFNDADMEDLIRARAAARFDCSPAIDVGPGLITWRCLALSEQIGPSWLEFDSEDDARAWFNGHDAPPQALCLHCYDWESGYCKGGCRARSQVRLVNNDDNYG